jgi:hypothetical protein
MVRTPHRVAAAGVAAFALSVFATIATPGVSGAVECGWGTVFDAPSNSCRRRACAPATAPTCMEWGHHALLQRRCLRADPDPVHPVDLWRNMIDLFKIVNFAGGAGANSLSVEPWSVIPADYSAGK